MKAWNYIKIDFDQEMGQEYSTIVQIIVKADRGKAIAWRSVRWHTRRKNSLNSQSAFYTHSAVCILHFVPSLHFVSGLQSAFCTNRYPWHQHSLFLVTVIRTTHNFPFFPVSISSFCKVCAKFLPKWNINSRKCYDINLSSDLDKTENYDIILGS